MRAPAGLLGLLALGACLLLAALAQGETAQSGNLRVALSGEIAPHTLPRAGKAPIRATVATAIAPAKKGKAVPQLRRLEIAINRNGVLDTTGLPVCPLEAIQPATTADALAACRDSLVGEGLFSAKVLLKGQAAFPSTGKLYAYNSRIDGAPAILAHVYGTQPAPASFTLVFTLQKAKGTFGTVLATSLPEADNNAGYVSGLSLTLGKTYSYRGKRHSYLAAGCPAPKGFPGVSFPFARARLSFAGGARVEQTLVRSCRARG